MERSSVQVATVLHRTSVVMVTGTAGIWVMRCTVHLASLVVAIVLRASLNVAIICVWTREICVMGQTTVVTTQMRAPVFAVSAIRFMNAGCQYWYRPPWSRSPDAICHILIYILLSSPSHDSQFCLHCACFNPLNAELNPICHLLALLEAHHIFHVSGFRVNQVACIFCRSVIFVTDFRNIVAHFIRVSYFIWFLTLQIFLVKSHIWEWPYEIKTIVINN